VSHPSATIVHHQLRLPIPAPMTLRSKGNHGHILIRNRNDANQRQQRWKTLEKKIFVQVSWQRAFGLPRSLSVLHVRDYGFFGNGMCPESREVGSYSLTVNGNQVAQGNGQFAFKETKELCVDSNVSPTSPPSASPPASPCTNTNETFKIKIGEVEDYYYVRQIFANNSREMNQFRRWVKFVYLKS